MKKRYVVELNEITKVELSNNKKFILKQGKRRIYLNLNDCDKLFRAACKCLDLKVKNEKAL